MGLIKGFRPRNKGFVNIQSVKGAVEFDDNKVGFYNATPVTQPVAIADIATTATTGSLPTANGAVVIADTATPTVVELLEYCVELEVKLEAALAALRSLGLIAST